jgi:hypothetical protein
MPDIPNPLDRSALERVLARAGELQSSAGDTPEEFTEEQIVELGKEVGLAPEHLRQALAEERTRPLAPEPESGLAARLIGPARIHASRTIPGTPREVLAALDGWMQREELLQVKRHLADRMTWEPRRDLFGTLRRALDFGRRGYALTRADEVAATVIPVDDKRVLVHIEASLAGHRRALFAGVDTAVVGGVAVGGALLLINVAALIAVPIAAIFPLAGVNGARGIHQRSFTRAQLALEQVLDRLERGQFGRPPSLLGALAAAAAALPSPPRRQP